jgi:diacylglycerol kinase
MKKLAKSVGHALDGIKEALSERNFKIQVTLGILTILAAIYVDLPFTHFLIIILCCVIVLGAEVANSAVERLADFVYPNHHEAIRKIKDLMAAAVLLLCGGALFIGILIFAHALS